MGFIYCLTFPNGKKYVGQTTRTVESRVRDHKVPSNKCLLVKQAYAKYGAFDVETLREVEDDELNDLEIHYIKELNTLSPNGYNLTTGGEGGIPSEETRARMRESHKNRVVTDFMKSQISKGLMGHILSDETKEKISQARLANPITPSEDNRRKINEAIRTTAVREKGSKSRRKDNLDLPMYVITVRKEKNPGYCIQIPGQPQKYFTSIKLSMEEKLESALKFREDKLRELNLQL